MNYKIKCVDVMTCIIDDATNEFAPIFRIKQDQYAILKTYCDALDDIAEDIGTISYELFVDDISMEINIGIEYTEIKDERSKKLMAQLKTRAKSVSTEAMHNGFYRVCFRFPGIWERAV